MKDNQMALLECLLECIQNHFISGAKSSAAGSHRSSPFPTSCFTQEPIRCSYKRMGEDKIIAPPPFCRLPATTAFWNSWMQHCHPAIMKCSWCGTSPGPIQSCWNNNNNSQNPKPLLHELNILQILCKEGCNSGYPPSSHQPNCSFPGPWSSGSQL